jgi:hypothetical protein
MRQLNKYLVACLRDKFVLAILIFLEKKNLLICKENLEKLAYLHE